MTQYHFSDADTSTVLDVIPSHHMGALLILKFKLNLLLCYFDQYLFKMRFTDALVDSVPAVSLHIS